MRRTPRHTTSIDQLLGQVKSVSQRHLGTARSNSDLSPPGRFRHNGVGVRKDRRRKRLLAISILAFLAALLVLGPYLWISYDGSWRLSNNVGGLRAALVDELSGTIPDSSFIDNATRILAGMGYKVDYYGPSQVTLGLFRDLPSRNYGIVVIRSHSGLSSIYTSEPYSKFTNVYEQLSDQVIPVVVDSVEYFGITAGFIQNSVRGSFEGSLIITMGCSGLSDIKMADAFIQKGATAYVGWDSWVSASTTDTYTTTLISSLSQGKTMKESVGVVSDKLSSDPLYGGRLGYYDASTVPRQHVAGFIEGLVTVVTAISLVAAGPIVALLLVKAVSGDLRLNPLRRRIRSHTGER